MRAAALNLGNVVLNGVSKLQKDHMEQEKSFFELQNPQADLSPLIFRFILMV
jgi:hypothetical protein